MKKKKVIKRKSNYTYIHAYGSNDNKHYFPVITNIKLSKYPIYIDMRDIACGSIMITKGKKLKELKLEDYD